MEFRGVEVVCPSCRDDFGREGTDQSGKLTCKGCGRSFPIVLGIPDLRIRPDPYIDPEQDRAKGKLLADLFGTIDFMGAVALYYRITDRVPPFQAQRFARSLAVAADRSRHALERWERAAGLDGAGRSLLDLGCGTAPLLQSAAARYSRVAGVDIAFRWLVLARKRLDEAGLSPPLICACAEALPFPDATFDNVVAESALEHMEEPDRALRESARVLTGRGWVFLATPNRLSPAPDPHTGLPLGSWLPDRATALYVRLKGGIPPHRHLLTARSLRKLLAGAGFDGIRIFAPEIPDAQKAAFHGAARLGIAAYQRLRKLPAGEAVLLRIGPLLHAVARKDATTSASHDLSGASASAPGRSSGAFETHRA